MFHGHGEVDSFNLEDNNVKMLQATVEKLEQQIQGLAMRDNSQLRTFLQSSLLEKAKERLIFDTDDVYRCIDSWDYFFSLYRVSSDYEQFLAVEQLLPPYVQRALALSKEFTPSYKWLVSYLKDRYDARYICHEMHRVHLDKCSGIDELEFLAMDAANSPHEELVKHFMLQSCNQSQKETMGPFLCQPLKDFKFKFKLMLQDGGDQNRLSVGKPCSEMKVDLNEIAPSKSVKVKKRAARTGELSRSIVQKVKKKERNQTSFVSMVGERRKQQRYVGWFHCGGCERNWVCYSLFCITGEAAGASRRCFSCSKVVVPGRVEKLGQSSLSRFVSAGTDGQRDQPELSESSSEVRWKHCFRREQSAHRTRDFNQKVCFNSPKTVHVSQDCLHDAVSHDGYFRGKQDMTRVECVSDWVKSWKYNAPRGETLSKRMI